MTSSIQALFSNWEVLYIVARILGRVVRGTGSRVEDRNLNEQGSIRGIHLWYGILGRGSRSTLFWIEVETNKLRIISVFLRKEETKRPGIKPIN
jgi:hypothetical protein